jgi:hypothetical protein
LDSRLAVDANAAIIAAMDAIRAVASGTISAVAISPMHANGPMWPDASSPVDATSADNSIGFGHLNGE